jgi:hypothetical protein
VQRSKAGLVGAQPIGPQSRGFELEVRLHFLGEVTFGAACPAHGIGLSY